MRPQIKHPPESFRPDRAFVVQLRPVDPSRPSQLAGRIEHIASGDSFQFGSLEELHSIMDACSAEH